MPARKKDPSVRARRNKATTNATLSGSVSKRERPSLPSSRAWLPETVAWWEDVWASPMAAEFHESDTHGLLVLAALIDHFWTEPDAKLAGEIRLQRQSFGLTPYDRRRLEWTIESADQAKDRGRARRARSAGDRPTPKPGDDPRSVLSVVS